MINCPFQCGYFDTEHQLLVCHPRGELTSDQMNDIAICRECIVEAGLQQVNRFHDLRDITSVHLTFRDVQSICVSESALRQNADKIIACYLVPNNLLYGTIRMYEAMIEQSGVEVHVSYDLTQLAAILGVDPSVLEPQSGGPLSP